MAKYEVVLADPDFRYIYSLGCQLLKEYGDEITLRLITEEAFFHSFFSAPQQVTLLVVHSDYIDEELRRQNFGAVIVLTENQDETPRGGWLSIYKYTSKDIYRAISNKLRHFVLDRSLIGTRIITVYSTQGGCGKTTLAYGLSEAIASFENKVLFINSESIQTFGRITNSGGWANDRLPMELLSGNMKEDTLAGSIKEGQPDVLKPLKHSFFSYGIGSENYVSLINHIKEKKLYDFIIVDTSQEMNRANADLMALSERVLLLITQDENGWDNYEAMNRNIDITDSEKYKVVCAVYDEERAMHTGDEREEVIEVRIPLSGGEREGNPEWERYLPLAYECV